MKTTKKVKGFTLIELIVVIAIIGVLAAILVPTMLGYVRKSKISSINTAASNVYKAINSALTELDEEGIDISGCLILNYDGTAWSTDETGDDTLEGNLGADSKFDKKVENFFASISKVKSGAARVDGGACVAVAVAQDKTYTGTYPTGVVTNETYETYKDMNVAEALTAAEKKAKWTAPSGSEN